MNIGHFTLVNPFILAPMAGVSEMPFRVISRQQGAAAAPTELVSAKGLLYGQARTERYMVHDVRHEQPFWVQIFGGEPESMADGAARAVDLGADIIDINMGCPVRKVTRNGAGSGLLCDPGRAAAIVAAIVARCPDTPVTAKIRAGWDQDSLNFLEVARALEDAGCRAIAMHARTRAQGYSGEADWRLIGELVSGITIPVIGNGDVKTAADALRMREETGCHGVMIGRAALGNPWIFRELAAAWPSPTAIPRRMPGAAPGVTPQERWQMVQAHLAAHRDFVADDARAVRRFRAHLMWYSHGLAGATAFRRQVSGLDELGELLPVCARFFAEAHHDAAGAAAQMPFDEQRALG